MFAGDFRTIEAWNRTAYFLNKATAPSGIIRSVDDAYRDEVEQLSKTKTKHCETVSDLIRLICRISPDILLGKYNEPPIDNIYGFVFNAEKLLNPDTYSSEYAAFIYEMKNLEKLGCSTLRTISYTVYCDLVIAVIKDKRRLDDVLSFKV